MNRHEHLLVRAAAECSELARRLSQAALCGVVEFQPGFVALDSPNLTAIYDQYYALRAVLGLCGIDAWDASERARSAEFSKMAEVDATVN